MSQTIDEGRAQLIANLQLQAEELAQLNKIAIALTSELDLPRLLQMMTDAARKLTSAEYAALFLIPEIIGTDTPSDKAVFTLAAISGATDHITHFRTGDTLQKGVRGRLHFPCTCFDGKD